MGGFKKLVEEKDTPEEEVSIEMDEVPGLVPSTPSHTAPPPAPTSMWEEIENAAEDVVESLMFCGVIGHEGTCKTGIVLDSLMKEELDKGDCILIVDFDGGGKTLRSSYHKERMRNIRTLNPWVMQKNSRDAFDYPATHNRTMAILQEAVDWAERQQAKDYQGPRLHTLLVTALDLWDTVAKNCMLIEDLGTAPDGIGAQIKPHEKVGLRFNWQIRATRFHMLTAQCRELMRLGVRCFVETHLKEEYDGHNPSGQYKPDWEKQTGNYLNQIIRMHKTPVRDETGARTGEVRYEAEFVKWKTDSDLVDQRRTVMVTNEGQPAKWFGLPELRGGE